MLDLVLSQDELEVYESSMRYLLNNLNEKIYETTGCTIGELGAFIDDITELFQLYVRDELLPEKYKK